MMFGGLHIEMAALQCYLSASIVGAAWPSSLGAGVVIRRSRVQGLSSTLSLTGFVSLQSQVQILGHPFQLVGGLLPVGISYYVTFI